MPQALMLSLRTLTHRTRLAHGAACLLSSAALFVAGVVGVLGLGLPLVLAQTPGNPTPSALSKRGIDVDGSGKSVLVVRANNAQMQIGRLENNQFTFTDQTDPGTAFRIVAISDMDGNGKSDLVVQNIAQGEFGDVHVWSDFAASTSRILRQVKQVWDVQAVGDLDGDGKGDMVWRYVVPNSPDTGVSYIWFSNGANAPVVRKRGGAPLSWKLLGAADLNADNAADMLYISPDNQLRVLMATSNRTCANLPAGNIPVGYEGLAFAEFTGRARGDVLIRNPATGQIALISLNASGITLPVYTGNPDDRNASCTSGNLAIPSQIVNLPTTDPNWRFYAAGDYDGNESVDVVWLKPDGSLALWLMGKDGTVQSSIGNAGSTAVGYASTNGTSYWSPAGGMANEAPSVSLTAPVNNAAMTVNTTLNITASAADRDGTVARVEFFAGADKVGEDSTSPFSLGWTPTIAGEYNLTARATDNRGATTTSAAIRVTVNAVTPVNQAPTVSLSSPASNSTSIVGTTVTIAVFASDADGSVAKVEFFANGTKLGEDSASPYTLNWVPSSAATYSLTAKATDDKGATTNSAAVNLTVDAVPASVPLIVDELNTTLANPWSLAFLPDGRMLVTERGGTLKLLSAMGTTLAILAGVPAVNSSGQGGLLDVVIDPAFASNQRIYLTFAENDAVNSSLNGTAVARAKLNLASNRLDEVTVIFRQTPKVASGGHFGSRLVFDTNGYLFVALGDRQNDDQRRFAQDPTRGNGKVMRITTEGLPAPGNPSFSVVGAQAGLWSLGHRNPQGAALDARGQLWVSEHGPQGGDEINLVQAGKNYGWPIISHGQEYGTTTQVGEGTAKDGMEQPVSVWITSDGSEYTGGAKSSMAPSGLAVYSGSRFPEYGGNIFSGALAGTALWRVVLSSDGKTEIFRQRLLANRGERIRDVRQGPDGWLYLLTDNGKLLRVTR